MSYPAISLATATVGRHRCPQKRLQTARQPPVYPNSSSDHRACNSLTPFRCPHAVHPCPSVDSGLENAEQETIRIKRRLWYDLLRTALGEIAYTTEGMSAEAQARLAKVGVGPEEMDDLFVRHTYLSAVIGMVVQASFGIDIRRLAETDPADLLQGRELYRSTGLQGVLESDFFA